jgi:hypothetical protein
MTGSQDIGEPEKWQAMSQSPDRKGGGNLLPNRQNRRMRASSVYLVLSVFSVRSDLSAESVGSVPSEDA